jgi:hypothetical protein
LTFLAPLLGGVTFLAIAALAGCFLFGAGFFITGIFLFPWGNGFSSSLLDLLSLSSSSFSEEEEEEESEEDYCYTGTPPIFLPTTGATS